MYHCSEAWTRDSRKWSSQKTTGDDVTWWIQTRKQLSHQVLFLFLLWLQCKHWSRSSTRWLHQPWPTPWNHASLVWEASIASLTNDPWMVSLPRQYWTHSAGTIRTWTYPWGGWWLDPSSVAGSNLPLLSTGESRPWSGGNEWSAWTCLEKFGRQWVCSAGTRS